MSSGYFTIKGRYETKDETAHLVLHADSVDDAREKARVLGVRSESIEPVEAARLPTNRTRAEDVSVGAATEPPQVEPTVVGLRLEHRRRLRMKKAAQGSTASRGVTQTVLDSLAIVLAVLQLLLAAGSLLTESGSRPTAIGRIMSSPTPEKTAFAVGQMMVLCAPIAVAIVLSIISCATGGGRASRWVLFVGITLLVLFVTVQMRP